MTRRKIEVMLVACLNVALIMSFISMGGKEKKARGRQKKTRIENKRDKGIPVSDFPNRFCYCRIHINSIEFKV